MDRVLEKAIRKYKKRTKALLLCDSKMAKAYLQDLDNSITDYVEENGVTDIEEIIAHFGDPEVVARAFFETADIRRIKKRMNIKHAVLIGILIAVAIWASAMTYISIDAHRSNHGYIAYGASEEIVTYSQANK